MGEVKEENERLKMYLDRIMTEYKALQMQFLETKKNTSPVANFDCRNEEDHHHTSLSLGPTISSSSSMDKKKKTIFPTNCVSFGVDKENLQLSLNCKMFKGGANQSETTNNGASSNSPMDLSSENSLEDQKEETDEFRPPSKVEKRCGDDEISQQNTAAKKTRVSVRARCDTPTVRILYRIPYHACMVDFLSCP